MEMGKFKADLIAGEVLLQYEIAEGAHVKLSAPVGVLALPVLDGIKVKIEAGEIDPIKGTELDKEAMLKLLEEIKKLLV